MTVDPIGNRFDRNTYGNITAPPIDLGDDGVTANDAGDGDTGPNHLLNYPAITSAVASGGQLTITGTLDVPPGTGMHTIDFHHAPSVDAFGIAQGAPIAQTTVNAGAGPQPFTHTFPSPITTGSISATAYSSVLFETSELSPGASVTISVTPEVSIANASKVEGNAGTSNMVFLVTMSTTSPSDVKVDYATTDGSATAPSDYASTNGTLTIPAGNGGATILVPINGDSTSEADETFTVTLSSPQNATLDDDTGVGTITNDDAAVVPDVTIADAFIIEGNAGTSNLSLTVTLSTPSASDVQVSFAALDGTAIATLDYTFANGTLTIPAGSTTGSIVASIIGDTNVESDETFTVSLYAPQNATISDSIATATITNDDAAAAVAPIPTVSEIGLALLGIALALFAFMRLR